MPKPAKNQHYLARFYLRNFAEPMFSNKLCYYDLRKHSWESRSPEGVGWYPHLCSMIDVEGNRTDHFDQFLKLNIEDPAAPVMKKLATGETIELNERAAVARFIALTTFRTPEMLNNVTKSHLEEQSPSARAELDSAIRFWRELVGKRHIPNEHLEFLKPTLFDAIAFQTDSLAKRLLKWQWNTIRTSRDQPFVTTDWPTLGEKEGNLHLVTFPISSEIALVISSGGPIVNPTDHTQMVRAMNLGTLHRSTVFVVACKESFPGDEFLEKRSQH